MYEQGIDRFHLLAVDGDFHALPYEVTKNASQRFVQLSGYRCDASIVDAIALRPQHQRAAIGSPFLSPLRERCAADLRDFIDVSRGNLVDVEVRAKASV